jgi:hypothetical protein
MDSGTYRLHVLWLRIRFEPEQDSVSDGHGVLWGL